MDGSSLAHALEGDSGIHGEILREEQGTNQGHSPMPRDHSARHNQYQTSVWMSNRIPRTLLHNTVPPSGRLFATPGPCFRLPYVGYLRGRERLRQLSGGKSRSVKTSRVGILSTSSEGWLELAA